MVKKQDVVASIADYGAILCSLHAQDTDQVPKTRCNDQRSLRTAVLNSKLKVVGVHLTF